MFNKKSTTEALPKEESFEEDSVETVVGPSVKVKGNVVSKGNILVQGEVVGSVRTSKNLRVEKGAKIDANVFALNAVIAGVVKGNMKVLDTLELTESAKILGDLYAKTLIVAAGAVLHGKCSMLEEPKDEEIEQGISVVRKKSSSVAKKKNLPLPKNKEMKKESTPRITTSSLATSVPASTSF